MSKLFRDTGFGWFIRLVTSNRFLKFPEDQENFQLPESYLSLLEAAKSNSKDGSSSNKSHEDKEKSSLFDAPLPDGEPPSEAEVKAPPADPFKPVVLEDGTIVVNWYGPDDSANPQNWTSGQKLVALVIIEAYSFAVYLGSSIVTGSYAGLIAKFGVSQQVVSLNLSMYVFAYGLGPMLWSPLSEIPSLGRNLLYLLTFGLFTILLVPAALVNNFAGLIVLRFLLGFFGSPCLATGPASLGDMYGFGKLPYAVGTWAVSATTGPAVGPLLSGYSVPATSWRWASWELLWLSGPLLIAFFMLVPETSAPNILLRRAQRLRARTGQSCFKSQGEIDQANMHPRDVVTAALWRPIQTMILDPSIGFTALYTALIYGIYYSFFECFPLVFVNGYRFSYGSQTLIYLTISVGLLLAMGIYFIWIRFSWEPVLATGSIGSPERRLVPALFASFLLPIGLFLFAWTARPDIHWIAPVFGIGIMSAGIFLIMQCIFLYLPLSYPMYAASVFAGNSVARSTMAAVIVHASQPLYNNLGVDRGVTVLGGITVGCIAGIFALWHYGASLRARSKFAP